MIKEYACIANNFASQKMYLFALFSLIFSLFNVYNNINSERIFFLQINTLELRLTFRIYKVFVILSELVRKNTIFCTVIVMLKVFVHEAATFELNTFSD